MTRIYSSLNSMDVYNLKNVLESAGIECEVRGEYRRSAIGELPVGESFIELWIVDDDRLEEARAILDAPPTRPWSCPKCGESVEAGFGQCWSCGYDRPS